jgi:hypothetical protein
MTDGYQVCPECEEEYTLAARVCAECGVALVAPGAVPEPAEPEGFPEIDALSCVRVGPLPWTRALSEALSARDIEHRIERDTRPVEEGGAAPGRFGGEIVYGTWVRPADAEGAAEVDRLLFGHLEPDTAADSQGDDRCPACQEPLAADALECPACGLAFG